MFNTNNKLNENSKLFNRQISECEVQGKKITLEAGRLARQASAAVYVSAGDNRVLVTVVSEKKDSRLDFFPLTVEFQEKVYSVGRVPGGFFKREGRPTSEAVLAARLIDRPIRPCFPKNYWKDTQIAASVLSADGLFPVEVLAGIGASAALHISDIPFKNPVAFIKAALVDEKILFNPSLDDLSKAEMSLTVAGNPAGLLMVEGEARFVSESQVLEALKAAHSSMEPVFKMQEDLRRQTGERPKRELPPCKSDENLKKAAEDFIRPQIGKALQIKEKTERANALDSLKEEALLKLAPPQANGETAGPAADPAGSAGPAQSAAAGPDGAQDGGLTQEEREKAVLSFFEDIKSHEARAMILSGKRMDGRKADEIRPIACEAGLLPRVHGSALFTRGETQVLGAVTLGTGDDEKIIDALQSYYKKRFFLHYNFPPYCVGETGRFGGGSRRETGHGFLAEKALKPVIPSHEDFPYTIRIVSEVLESNGSSSMGTVCSGMTALLNAGVPVKKNIAGVAMGLVKEGDKTVILSDILGDEDHLGDMDFKAAGSRDGITALQMDIKTDGIGFDVMEKALNQALAGRIHILNEMEKTIAVPNKELSVHAPRIETLKVKPDKIREVIGPGGKVINGITEETGVKINIEDDGTIYLASPSLEGIEKAKKIIEDITAEAEVGRIYEGVVDGVRDFGAFVEILPKTSGLLHISQISKNRINEVSDVLKEGDRVKVKVLNVDESGKIRLSAKAVPGNPY